MIYKWDTYKPKDRPPDGPVRSVVFPEAVFTRRIGSREWTDNEGNVYTNLGAVLYEYPSGVEDVPQPKDPVVEAIQRLRAVDWAMGSDGLIVLEWAEKNHPGMNNA